MPPIFHPPPFTPSHPVFTHLASIASRGSDEIRSEAEARLANAVDLEVVNVARSEVRYTHIVFQINSVSDFSYFLIIRLNCENP